MRTQRMRWVLAAATGFMVWSPLALADTRVRGRDAQFVSAYGGSLAWSEPTSSGVTHRLVISDGRSHLTIRTPTSSGLISPDVGRAPDRAGGQPRTVFGACSAGGRCGLYVLDAGAAHGVRVPGTRLLGGALYVAPSQWEDTYVYGRIRSDEPQTGRSRTGGGLFVQRPGGKPVRVTARVPQSTDIEGNRYAYAYWSSNVRSSEIRLADTVTGNDCQVTRASGTAFLSNPVFDGGHLYYLRRNARTGGGRIERVQLPSDRGGCPRTKPQIGTTRLPRAAGGEEGGVDDLAVTDGTVYYSALGIYRADPAPFPAR